MSKKELFDIPVLSQAITGLGAFPVNRKKLEVSTIKMAKSILTDTDWCLGIFPQGTRVMDGTTGIIKSGFGHLARATKSTIVPVVIDLKRGIFPFYGKIVIKVGKPMPPIDDSDVIVDEWAKAVSKIGNLKYIKTESLNSNELKEACLN
jgi:1-acyl-sn-glycerol-3-phosphate acyltransferase